MYSAFNLNVLLFSTGSRRVKNLMYLGGGNLQELQVVVGAGNGGRSSKHYLLAGVKTQVKSPHTSGQDGLGKSPSFKLRNLWQGS